MNSCEIVDVFQRCLIFLDTNHNFLIASSLEKRFKVNKNNDGLIKFLSSDKCENKVIDDEITYPFKIDGKIERSISAYAKEIQHRTLPDDD